MLRDVFLASIFVAYVEPKLFSLSRRKILPYSPYMSALSLEKNGRISPLKRTKHIKAKYFIIKDYYNADKVDYDIVLQVVCGQMFWRNHYKGRCLEICERSFRTV